MFHVNLPGCRWKKKSWKNEGQESEAITSVFEQGSNLNQNVHDLGGFQTFIFRGQIAWDVKLGINECMGVAFILVAGLLPSPQKPQTQLERAGPNSKLDQVLFPQVYQRLEK